MRAELTIKDPGNLEATISFTMRLSQWIEVNKALKGTPYYGPTGEIKQAIDDLARKACGTFRFDIVEEEAP
ncbi:hypothetical protein [Bosea sp. AS-1]|uniref:hypothetical protein n=1 Tax=Bosea sp. AS-1 TaxID=2015316 RepID=UPI000B77C443|nr:hypothetical protein [Bosea sp. AS-1]